MSIRVHGHTPKTVDTDRVVNLNFLYCIPSPRTPNSNPWTWSKDSQRGVESEHSIDRQVVKPCIRGHGPKTVDTDLQLTQKVNRARDGSFTSSALNILDDRIVEVETQNQVAIRNV